MKFPSPLLVPQPQTLRMDAAGRAFAWPAIPDFAGPEADPDVASPVTYKISSKLPTEGYQLSIAPRGVKIVSSTAAGARYARRTLSQLRRQYGPVLPCLEIEDAPDFPIRGFMLDVSRGKVPTLQTLFQLVDLLSFLKYNQLQLYVEHVYDFKKHPAFGRGHSPLTADELRRLDDFCHARGVELVPNLQSFGHAWHILNNKKYARLAESDYRGGWTLSPVEPGTYQLLKEMYEEFLPNFRHSKIFNVGCDETYDLAKGKSARLAERVGVGGVYLGHLIEVHELVADHGLRMAFWGDIIAHYPELLASIPKDVILLNWGYEAHGQEKLYGKRLAPAAKSGLEHWVCPGTSSWNSFFFRLTNARVNLRRFAQAGLKAGASGYLVTDWGDHNHYNFIGNSYWPIAYGADAAWRAKPDAAAERKFDLRFTTQIMADAEGALIEPLRLLGELYQTFGVMIPNNSAERWLFGGYPEPDILGVTGGELTAYNAVSREALEAALEQADRAAAMLARFENVPAANGRGVGFGDDLARLEWLVDAWLAAHACRIALWRNYGVGSGRELLKTHEIILKDFEALWMKRNKKSDFENIRTDFARVAEQLKKRKPQRLVF